jgi:transcriptional regulator with GAF, ATPase, and Fis domain
LSATLIESELFGHVRGAFTGAESSVRGVFERADGGTLFLDEVGELPLNLQPKLLRVLETKTVRRLGAEKSVAVDVRVLAATHRDLPAAVRDGSFRQDLFFRLNPVSVTVPPLRERREDIPELVRLFLERGGDPDVALEPSTLQLLTFGYDWPGNVRELKHAVAHLRALGTVPADLEGRRRATAPVVVDVDGEDATFREAKRRVIDAFERDFLRAKLDRSNGNISQAARLAGMERTQFKRLLRKHGLNVIDAEGDGE